MAENKIKYGLSNVHYCTATFDGEKTVTYGPVKAVKGAVNLSISPVGEINEFYADDVIYYESETNEGYEGELEFASMPEDFEKDALNIAESQTDKVLVETSSTEKKYYALFFEFKGDVKAVRHVLYYCSASRYDVKGKTKGKSIEPNTDTIKFKAFPHPVSGNIKAKTGSTTTSEAYDAWYSKVWEKDSVVL